jgi:hypothetical protein
MRASLEARTMTSLCHIEAVAKLTETLTDDGKRRKCSPNDLADLVASRHTLARKPLLST